jgi:hypothetical protein
MKWDLFGGGLAVIAIGLTLSLALPPPWWPKMPSSLVHGCIAFGVIIAIIGLALLLVGILPAQLESRAGPLVLFATALGLATSSLMWWHWIGVSTEESEDNESLDGRILVECTDEALPSAIPASGNLFHLSLHPAATQVQLGRFSLPPGAPVNWGIKSVGTYKCEVKNFSKAVIAHVEIPFKVMFYKDEKTEHGGRSGDLVKEEDQPIQIPALRENASDAFEFYIYNTSELYVTVLIPTEASAWLVGEDDKRTVKLMKPTFYRGLTLYPAERNPPQSTITPIRPRSDGPGEMAEAAEGGAAVGGPGDPAGAPPVGKGSPASARGLESLADAASTTPALRLQRPTIREKSAAAILGNLKEITLPYRFREKVEELYIGRWTQEPGWRARIVDLPSKSSGLRWHCSLREVESGTLLFAITVQDASTLRTGDLVTVSGRISDVRQSGYVSLEDAVIRADNDSSP